MVFSIKEEIAEGEWKEDFSSSHINALLWLRDYDSTEYLEQAVGRLYVEFQDSKVYLYFDVPYNTFYYLWRRAPSKGGYFHRNVRSTQDNMIFSYWGHVNRGVGFR